ncbi:MAG: hypothetical protein ABI557_03370 [Aureliella sp.]
MRLHIIAIVIALATMSANADETSVVRNASFESTVVIFNSVCREMPERPKGTVEYIKMQEFAVSLRDWLKHELQGGYRLDRPQLAEDLQANIKQYVDFKNRYGLEHVATQRELRKVSFVARLLSETDFSDKDIDQITDLGNIGIQAPRGREVLTVSPTDDANGRNSDKSGKDGHR